MDMTTRLHLGCDEARTLLAYPLTTLAWLETMALKTEMAPYLRRSRGSDRWYVCQGDETFGPVPFAKIMRMLLRGEGPLPVLHESDVDQQPPPWRVLTYRTWPMGTAARIAWIAGCWLFAVCAGFVIVSLATPLSARPMVGAVYLALVAAAGVWLGVRARGTADSPQTEPETPADGEPPSDGGMD
jgi:hypothetical protein